MAVSTPVATDKLYPHERERLATTATGASSTLKLENKRLYSVQVVLDNTDEVGTIDVQLSNDGTNWNSIWYRDSNGVLQTSALAVTSGTDVNHWLDPIETAAAYLRVYYTYTSGGDAARFFYIYLHSVNK